jgi:outer membrane protein assembly factor BamD (BamD/ComL family)
VKVVHTRFLALLLLVPLFAGCAANNTKPKPAIATYDQYIQQADARYQAQDIEGAKALYSKAAAADPTKEVPWYRLAQINFDQQNYGQAIVDAQEVLRRNPANTDAESLMTIAGLRVAVDALGRLHDEANQHGPAHLEAEKLAAKMRETLGQDVLVPPAAKPKKKPIRKRSTQNAPTPTPGTDKTPASSSSGANPFQALPGGSH